MKINREDLEQILIDNFTGKDGDLDLRDLDFREFNGDILLNGMKAKQGIINHYQEAEWIDNTYQKAEMIANTLQQAKEIWNKGQEADEIKSVKSI